MRNNYAERKKCTTHFSVGEAILSLFVCAESRNLAILFGSVLSHEYLVII